MDFCERLKITIKYFGLKREDFAKQCGISRSQLFRYLNGDQEPGTLFYKELKKSFPEIDINWLISGVGDVVQKKIEKSPYEDFDAGTSIDSDFCEIIQKFRNVNRAKRLNNKLLMLEFLSESQLDRVEKEIDRFLEIAEDVVADIKKAEDANWQKDKEQKKEAVMASMGKTQRRKKAAG